MNNQHLYTTDLPSLVDHVVAWPYHIHAHAVLMARLANSNLDLGEFSEAQRTALDNLCAAPQVDRKVLSFVA